MPKKPLTSQAPKKWVRNQSGTLLFAYLRLFRFLYLSFTIFCFIKTVIFCGERCYFGDFLISVDSLSGLNVISSDGLVIGEVKSAEIDANKWQVTHLQVKLSSKASEDLGFKKRFKSSIVSIPVTLITSVGDVILLGRSMKELGDNTEIYESK